MPDAMVGILCVYRAEIEALVYGVEYRVPQACSIYWMLQPDIIFYDSHISNLIELLRSTRPRIGAGLQYTPKSCKVVHRYEVV